MCRDETCIIGDVIWLETQKCIPQQSNEYIEKNIQKM